MFKSLPRIIIGALKGGSGKTIFSLGIASVFRQKGYKVAVFKKGPDFIDAGWLAFAVNRPCHNLDPFLMTENQILKSFMLNSADADISLIEGNRGLFDGLDLDGCCSTAELAKLIKSPVLIIADVTMATRTIAALILGCREFDPDLNIAGVILNRVAGKRQENLVRNSIEKYCGIPVLGAVPKLKEDVFPERHMGLVPYQEREHALKAIDWSRSVVEKNINFDIIFELAAKTDPLCISDSELDHPESVSRISGSPRIGFIRDGSFWFYYPENLEQIKKLGADLIEINSMTDQGLPDLDALYIGGGFPETRAKTLADNKTFRDSLKLMIDRGMPVYAECGGLIYMGETLHLNDNTYPMVGALPIRFEMDAKPQGHGYSIIEVEKENPFYPVGEVFKGHEFHYSKPVFNRHQGFDLVFKMQRGHGLDGRRDGLLVKNLLATYSHVHAGGYLRWGESLVRAAINYKKTRREKYLNCL